MSFIIEKREAFVRYCALRAIQKFEPGIIAIGGGIGKTITQAALVTVLEDIRTLETTRESVTKHLRIPYAALGIKKDEQGFFFWIKTLITAAQTAFFSKKYPELLLLEYPIGESANFISVARPQITVITAHAHADETDAVRLLINLPSNGYAVINNDDLQTRDIARRTRARTITFGFEKGADLILSNLAYRSEKVQGGYKPAGISFTAEYGNQSAHVVMDNALSKASAYAAAAAMCVGTAFGLHLARTAEALRYLEMPRGRINLFISKKGVYILDDSASKTEESIMNALEAVAGNTAKRIIGVFGTAQKTDGAWRMQEALNRLASKACDAILTVGDSPINIDSKKKLRFDNGEAAAAELQAITERGDLVLITGQGLEAVIEAFSSYRLVVRT